LYELRQLEVAAEMPAEDANWYASFRLGTAGPTFRAIILRPGMAPLVDLGRSRRVCGVAAGPSTTCYSLAAARRV